VREASFDCQCHSSSLFSSWTTKGVTSSPAVAKGKVVVATADGQVICFG
jgi:hypothetical protein